MAKIKKLTSNEIEAANRAEATALLIRAGHRVYRPEADCYGEDLILRTPNEDLLVVQLKSRPTVNWNKYGKSRTIWMLFPDPKSKDPKRKWFLVPHNEFYEWVKVRHGRARKWNKAWHCPSLSGELHQCSPLSHRKSSDLKLKECHRVPFN
jgi:hypothetical protein